MAVDSLRHVDIGPSAGKDAKAQETVGRGDPRVEMTLQQVTKPSVRMEDLGAAQGELREPPPQADRGFVARDAREAREWRDQSAENGAEPSGCKHALARPATRPVESISGTSASGLFGEVGEAVVPEDELARTLGRQVAMSR